MKGLEGTCRWTEEDDKGREEKKEGNKRKEGEERKGGYNYRGRRAQRAIQLVRKMEREL